MKARLYAMAWRVLPYVCCASMGATLTSLLVGGYYWARDPLGRIVSEWYLTLSGLSIAPTTPRVPGVLLLLIALVIVWKKLVYRDSRFQPRC